MEKSVEVPTITVEPWEVEKDVAVNFPTFTPGQTLSFEPIYTPAIAGGGFKDNDVTYTVTVTGTGVSKTYNSENGFDAKISDGYSNFNTYTFTQTFKNSAETVIGSQVVRASVMGSNFVSLVDAEGTLLSPQLIPSLPLDTLEKSITDLDSVE
jgi:hypothetical protein